jgi:hypothetical protein
LNQPLAIRDLRFSAPTLTLPRKRGREWTVPTSKLVKSDPVARSRQKPDKDVKILEPSGRYKQLTLA